MVMKPQHDILFEKTSLQIRGQSRMCAFRPGAVATFLAAGISLNEVILNLRHSPLLIYENVRNNLVVNNGLGLMADLIIATFGNGLTYHAIGTGTTAPAITDTQLQTEVGRNAFATRTRSANVATLDAFYPLAQSNYNIKEEGVFGGTASGTANSGTLFSHYAQVYNNTVAQADLTFEYRLTLTGA